jgi:hypothetical protein
MSVLKRGADVNPIMNHFFAQSFGSTPKKTTSTLANYQRASTDDYIRGNDEGEER